MQPRDKIRRSPSNPKIYEFPLRSQRKPLNTLTTRALEGGLLTFCCDIMKEKENWCATRRRRRATDAAVVYGVDERGVFKFGLFQNIELPVQLRLG